MTDVLTALSSQLATAADTAGASIVQVQAHRRPVAGVVCDTDLVLSPGVAVQDGVVSVRRGDGQTFEGTVLGRNAATGLTVVRVSGLGAPAATTAPEPRAGHMALAVGRTWSGGLFSALAPVSVVGGPLRTGRSSEIARVDPHRPAAARRAGRRRAGRRQRPRARRHHLDGHSRHHRRHSGRTGLAGGARRRRPRRRAPGLPRRELAAGRAARATARWRPRRRPAGQRHGRRHAGRSRPGCSSAT